MGKVKFTVMLSLMIMLITSACSTTPESPTEGADKSVIIVIESLPDPPAMGDVEFKLIITDDQGKPVEGAIVELSLDHTDMTGMEMNGLATQQSPGNYAITANFSMTGNWKMTVYVRKDGLDYQEEIFIKVQ